LPYSTLDNLSHRMQYPCFSLCQIGHSACSGVTMGEQGGHLPPGAAFWGRQIDVRMLRNNYKISNTSGCYPVAKSHQDHPSSQSKHPRNSTFKGGASVSSNQRPHVFRFTAASQCFPIARVANFPAWLSFHSFATDHNGAVIHCSQSLQYVAGLLRMQSSDESSSMLLRKQIWRLGNFLSCVGLTNFMLKWIWCGSEGSYDDFYCGIFK